MSKNTKIYFVILPATGKIIGGPFEKLKTAETVAKKYLNNHDPGWVVYIVKTISQHYN